jgi:TPR repeat protein
MQLYKISYLKTFLILCGATAILSGCTSGITRTGYRLPAGQTSVATTNRLIAIKYNVHYSTNDVVLLGSIHAYDTGFSTRCDEAYVLGIFSEEGRMLGADVINITGERQPDFWSTCYQARAQFLRFKDRKMAMEVSSDPKYAPDLVAERSERSKELATGEIEAAVVGGALGGAASGVIAGSILASESTPSRLADLHARAENGDATAQRLLGEDYDFGHGVRKNYKKAAGWYQLAANRGDAVAQINLGSFYQYGISVATNYSRAVELYRQSAAQGFMVAQCNLGYMYDYGLGVPEDKVMANTWYQKAADQNYPGAMLNLGCNYASGNGIQRNLPQAYMLLDSALWLSQSSDDTVETSKERSSVFWQPPLNGEDPKLSSRIQKLLNTLKMHMSPEQIDEGKRLSEEWRGNYQKIRK